MKNTNDMKEEEGSTAGEITGMKAQTDIGKKKRGADARKGETEKGGEEAARERFAWRRGGGAGADEPSEHCGRSGADECEHRHDGERCGRGASFAVEDVRRRLHGGDGWQIVCEPGEWWGGA